MHMRYFKALEASHYILTHYGARIPNDPAVKISKAFKAKNLPKNLPNEAKRIIINKN